MFFYKKFLFFLNKKPYLLLKEGFLLLFQFVLSSFFLNYILYKINKNAIPIYRGTVTCNGSICLTINFNIKYIANKDIEAVCIEKAITKLITKSSNLLFSKATIHKIMKELAKACRIILVPNPK